MQDQPYEGSHPCLHTDTFLQIRGLHLRTQLTLINF